MMYKILLYPLAIFILTGMAQALPTISVTGVMPINEDTPSPNWTVNIGGAGTLTLTKISSTNPTLIPLANVSLGGTGTSRTVQVNPALNQFGATSITLRVTDNTGSTDATFNVVVNSVNDLPTISTVSPRTTAEDTTPEWPLTVGDVETAAGSLNLSVIANTNPSLLSSVTFGGSGAARTLRVTPALNDNGSGMITVQVTDGNGGMATVDVNITVTPVNDLPTISGSLSSPVNDTAGASSIFSGVVIGDVDDGSPGAPLTETLMLTLSIDQDDRTLGKFNEIAVGTVGGVQVVSSTDSQLVISGRPSILTGFVSTMLTFAPNANSIGVGDHTLDINVSVQDLAPAVMATLQSTYRSINDPATVSVSTAGINAFEGVPVFPFANFSLSDADFDENVQITITPTAGFNGGSPNFTGTIADAVSHMRGLSFTPADTVTFNIGIVQVHPMPPNEMAVNLTATLSVTAVNRNPEIAGITTTLIRVEVGQPIALFSPSFSVTDADGDSLNVSITFDSTRGILTSENGDTITVIGNDHSLAAMSPATATTALRALRFTPSAIPGGVIGFTLSVSDSASTATDARTRVDVGDTDDSPFITAPLANPVSIAPNPPVLPFANVDITDDSASITVTVTLDDDAKGTLSGYTFTGSPASVTAALKLVEFVASSAYPFAPDAPGGTTFTITADDGVTASASVDLSVILIADRRNHLVTKSDDVAVPPAWSGSANYAAGDPVIYEGNVYSRIAAGSNAVFVPAEWSDSADAEGTLRVAIALAAPNDVITFALPAYPALIRLNSSIVIDKNLTLLGPGADQLVISGDSNNDGSGDDRLFRVSRSVVIESLTLTKGKSDNGGAISVTENGNLTLRACAITECEAANWGGAVDVAEGTLTVDGCVFANNRTNNSLGLGGGAISIYTSQSCSITNTTFSGNAQGSNTGYGGGAVYAEAYSAALGLDLNLSHCTFAGNTDAASAGSSLQANVFGTAAVMKNCIVADSNGGNLEIVGAATISSAGGNLSDDQTRSTLVQGGVPQSVFHFDQSSDQTLIDPQLDPLGMSIGSLAAYAISANSPAVGSAIAVAAATDGRGVMRTDGAPDSGAFEAGAPQLLILNEIGFATATPFLEFYSPRNAMPLDLNGISLWVDGTLVVTFAGVAEIQPGFGVIVANGALTGNGTPVVQAPTMVLLERGLVELRTPDDGILLSVRYNGTFTTPDDPATDYLLGATSITLAPQFVGSAYVPHTMVQSPDFPGMNGVDPTAPGDSTSPGRDTGNKRFGASNALPNAVADTFELTEDQVRILDVLGNDSDADGSDKLVIVGVNGAATANSVEGAALVLSPANNGTPATPHRGLSISYDPRVSAGLQSLPVGTERVDTFQYTIVDITTGTANSFAADPGNANVTVVNTPAHRLLDGVEIKIAGAGIYAGTHTVTITDPNKFTIPVSFAGAAPAATWEAVESRPLGGGADDTQRDSATVTVTVLGANDAPIPVADTVTTPEDTVLRIMADSALAGTSTVFDTDPAYPLPRMISNESLLIDDADPDTDDDKESLKLVGVVGGVEAINAYAQAPGPIGVTVNSTAHGLTTGDTVLIAGYGGHPSYNGVHSVTVVGADRFTIPVTYVDNHAAAGVWTKYAPGAQLSAVSEREASVTLEIRADRRETNIVYNPRPSAYLDGIAMGDTENDTFYYVVIDSHGARGLAKITVSVTGVNDNPVPGIDPGTLAALGLPTGDLSALGNALGKLATAYLLPSSDGAPDRVLVGLIDPANSGAGATVVDQFWITDEDTPLILNIDPATSGPLDPLGNDTDIDRGDILTINTPGTVLTSREGASVTVSADGRSLIYDPSVPTSSLNALSRDERLIDTVIVTVNDGHGPGVQSLIAILVNGLNDTPRPDVLPALVFTGPEDELTVIDAPGVLADDVEPDENVTLPDNRKIIVPSSGQTTTVANVVYSTTAAGASGAVTGFAPGGLFTVVSAPGHPLNPGEEVVVRGTGEVPYEGQFVVLASDANSFTISVPFVAGSESSTGEWASVRSQVHYDPRGSLFDHQNPSIFALDGLAVGQTYIDTISYEIFDGSYVFAMDDMFKVAADSGAVDLDVLANDSNLTGLTTQMNLVSVSPTSAGGAVEVADGKARYTPPAGFVGDEVFTYIAEDELGNRDTAQVFVRATVEPLNGNLQANDDAFTVALGQSPVLPVLANDDILPDGAGVLTITAIVTLPGKGTATQVDGGIRYVPNAAVSGMDSFQYELSGGGTARAIATVNIEIVDRENALFSRADAFSVTVGSVDNELDVLGNDNILPGNGLVLSVTPNMLPANGTLVVNASGDGFLYTPAAGFTGVDTFTYIASDGYGGTGTAAATVTVGSLVTNSDFFVVPAGAIDKPLLVLENDTVLGSPAGSVVLSGVSATAGGAPGASLTLGALGSVAVVGGEIQFTAVATAGEATFYYTITDPSNRTAVGMATVAVVADGITGNTDFFSVLVGSAPTDLDVLANDISVPLRPLAILSIGTGLNAPNQGGSAQIVTTPNGARIRYQPAAAFVGEEIFTYTVSDSTRTDTATVVMRVGLGDLYANADTYTVYYQLGTTPPNSFTLPVLVNDLVLPANGETLTITGVGINHTGDPNAPNMDGSVEISEDGTTLIYTPAEDAALVVGSPAFVETFTYVISDGTDRRAEAQVQVEVQVRDETRDMDTNDDAFTIATDSLANSLDVLANDSIKPAPALGWTITGVSAPVTIPVNSGNGGVASVANGAILYSPAAGFVGTVTMTYNVSDGLGGTGRADVVVKVGDVRVCDDQFAVLSDSSDNTFDVLANDGVIPVLTPLGGFVLDAGTALTPDNGGSATVVGGMINYEPAPGFVGLERFEYTVIDNSGNAYPGEVIVSVEPRGEDRATGTAEIIVTGVNDLPVISAVSTFSITNKQVINPYAGVTLTDVDDQGQEMLSLSLELSNPASGWLYHPGGLFTRVGNAWVTGPMSQVAATAALRGVQLQPLDGTNETITVSLSVNDGHAVVTDDSAVVEVASPPMSKIVPDVIMASAAFGSSVSVSGDTMAVGSSLRNAPGADSGSVYIYSRTMTGSVENWVQSKIVIPADGAAGDRFGTSLALAGDTLVVGAPFDDNAGSAYIFGRNVGGAENWGLVKKLLVESPLRAVGDQFGIDVDIDGDTVIVGAPYADRVAGDTGMARVYGRNQGGAGNWGLVQEIVQSDAVFLDWFGVSVAVSGDRLIVGAFGANRQQNAANFDLGAAYIFEKSGTWQQVKKLERFSDPRSTRDDYFGWAVDISGDTVIVGSYLLDAIPSAPNSGAAFLYQCDTGGAGNWGELLEIRSDSPLSNEQLGYSVAIDGNIALVGMNSFSTVTLAGYVQCYVRDLGTNNWRFTDKLSPPVITSRTGYGYSVAVDRGAAVVSAPFENGGAVYSAQLELPLPATSILTGVDLLANPDGDAYTNAVELLMGTNPNQADPAGLIKVVPAPGGGYSMIYQRAKDFPVALVHPAWSTNLTMWSRAGLVETVEADLGAVEQIRVDFLNAPAPADAFLRLEIGD